MSGNEYLSECSVHVVLDFHSLCSLLPCVLFAGNTLNAYSMMSSPLQIFHLCVLQVWSCGGSIEVIPCSKIAHIERARKPYLPDLSEMMKRNALRVAEVWLDEYKYNVNIAWNLPLEVRGRYLMQLQIQRHKLGIRK